MTTAPSTYVTGLCASGFHDRCRGTYAGVQCGCGHHTAPPQRRIGSLFSGYGGLEQGVQQVLGGTTEARRAQSHALGNGVVPQQAAHALRLLLPDAYGAAA